MRQFNIHDFISNRGYASIVLVPLQDIINNIYRILTQGRMHASLSTQYIPASGSGFLVSSSRLRPEFQPCGLLD